MHFLLYIHLTSVKENSEGSGEIARMCRLAYAIALCKVLSLLTAIILSVGLSVI